MTQSQLSQQCMHTKCCGGAGLQLEAKLSGRRQIKSKLYCISLTLALLGSCKRFCAFNLKKTHVQQHIKVHLSPLATVKVRVKRILRLQGKRCSIVRLNPQTRRDWKAKHLQCASFVTLWTRKAMWQMSKAKFEKKEKRLRNNGHGTRRSRHTALKLSAAFRDEFRPKFSRYSATYALQRLRTTRTLKTKYWCITCSSKRPHLWRQRSAISGNAILPQAT